MHPYFKRSTAISSPSNRARQRTFGREPFLRQLTLYHEFNKRGKEMITFTESAVRKIQELVSEQASDNQLLRILVKSGGCSGMEYGMTFEAPGENETPFESNGVRFLIDSASLKHMDGSVIHFDDGLHGKGFEINNPNATSTCGCGRSFS